MSNQTDTDTYTFRAVLASDRRKNPEKRTYRHLTLDECKALRPGDRISAVNPQGEVVQVTINGVPKTWKTRPGDVRVPWKYGLYQYGYFVFTNGEMCGRLSGYFAAIVEVWEG